MSKNRKQRRMEKGLERKGGSLQAIQGIFNDAFQHHHAGRLVEAEQLYRRVLTLDDRHADSLHSLGVISRQAGHPDVAIELISKAIAVRRDDPFFHYNLGNAFKDLDKPDEAAACYERSIALNPNLAEAHNNLGVIRQSQHRLDEAKTYVMRAIGLKPDYAEAHFNLGNILRDQGRIDDAKVSLQRAAALRPDVDVLINLGGILQDQGRFDAAKVTFERALSLKPDSIEALNNLGTTLRAQGKLAEAVSYYERALALKPDYVAAHSNLCNALADQGKLGEAAEQGRIATALDLDDPNAHYNSAAVYLVRGDFEKGWPEYEWRWALKDTKPHGFKQPLWNGQSLNGKTILLHCEQGLGDSIQFVRYASEVKKRGGKVLLLCPPSLSHIFKTVEGIDTLIEYERDLPAFDVHAALMSLPGILGTRLDTIPAPVPYLHADKTLVAKWQKRLLPHDGLKIGIVWRGNPAHKNDRNRSMRPETFATILNIPGIAVINLQKDAKADELAVLKGKGPFYDPAPDLTDFNETAAVIASLDLVISVDTSVCHLAGAMGIPVWTLIPFAPDWRWLLEREDSPWYPTMRLFRQSRISDWGSVCETARAELERLVKGDRNALKPISSKAPAKAPQSMEADRRRHSIETGQTDIERWSDEKQLEKAWDARAQFAANYIPAGAVVLDLGCGQMALEGFLPKECRYIPCDVAARDERTIICDFNAGSYPDGAAENADLISFLGVMEYIFDAKAFLAHLRQWRRPVVMSYCANDGIRDREHRRNLGWVNDYSYDELVSLLKEVGFSVQRSDRIDNVQWLFRLQPEIPVVPALKKVAVLSYYNAGNFGDRVGYHLMHDILPEHAEVTNLTFKPWTLPADTYDLLIIGMGNSIFGPMFNESLLSLLDKSRAAIGIFGTQYHESIPRPMLDSVVSRLDHWYTRYEDDVLRYGRGLDNVSHLGDWLIHAFPMARPTLTERLSIGDEVLQELPLDRTIQTIQRYKSVFSTRLHPLLCALTSAEMVGYREQREVKGLVSGKFRSLLLDVFGRTFPEEEMWPVDRTQVLAYKTAIGARALDLRARIHGLLN